MTRSHTAKNNNISMVENKYESNSMNNNSSSTSSPSKSKVTANNIETENKFKQSKNNSTPTKKSVTNSILSFTSSILAAAASATKEELSSSPEQSPSRERRKVIDMSSSHSSPLKRASTPSASPTRRGGRATKPSPHQGTPPQSPPTPHKIICQATVETIEPPVEATSDVHDIQSKLKCDNRNRSSPIKRSSPGLKLISSLSPKKHTSHIDKEISTSDCKEITDKNINSQNDVNINTASEDKVSNLPARRNLTSDFLQNDTSVEPGQSNENTVTKPKKR